MNSISSFNPVFSTTQVSAPQGQASADNGVDISYNSQDAVVIDQHVVHMPTLHSKPCSLEGNDVAFKDTRFLELKPNDEGTYTFKPGTKKHAAAASMVTVQKTIDEMSAKFGKLNWAFGAEKIGLNPDAGTDFNAYYTRDGGSLNFFHGNDRAAKNVVYSGASGEVVSHEVGHAVLDAVRPGYFDTWKTDTNGFHEAFGDLTALYMSTQDDAACALAVQETGGDLHKPSCLSRTGEQLGRAINAAYGTPDKDGHDCVRSLINDCKWQDPNTVGKDDPSLSTEMHSWSRIFSGANYDILADITAKNIADGMNPAEAIKAAGDTSMTLLAEAVKMAPAHDASYKDIALLMLKADDNNGGAYHDIILNNMRERNILGAGDDTPSDFSIESVGTRPMTITLGDDCGMFAGAEVTGTVRDCIGLDDTNPGAELAQDLKLLIQNGCILYTEPNQKVETKDLFDKNGNPYIGVVRWTDGKMVIERNKMIG